MIYASSAASVRSHAARRRTARPLDRRRLPCADERAHESAVDLLEHGRTFLRDVVDGLELSTADVVANSLGAFLSVAFALDAPGRVSRLVLVGAPFGVARRPPLVMLPIGFPLIGQPLGRYLFANATREGSRKFWGQVIVKHPERVDDLTLAELLRRRDPARLATCFASARDGQPEPLCAVYEPASRAPLVEYVRSGRDCPRRFLAEHDVRMLEPRGAALENANTPEDAAAARSALATRRRA